MADAPTPLTVADYEEVLTDHRRLVREIDVIINGEDGAAKQASLCDLVGQIGHLAALQSERERDARDVAALREKISDAAYEWQQYVSEDSAPINLVEHMERAFDAAMKPLPAAPKP